MRHRTKHRRRFHTDRVISNRQQWYRHRYPDDPWGGPFPNGRLKHTNAYGDCGNPRCGVCHGEKFYYPNEMRLEGVRICRDWWLEY